MGWMALTNKETGKEVGIVGDEAWDAAGIALESLRQEINSIYLRVFNRKATDLEFNRVIEFANPFNE